MRVPHFGTRRVIVVVFNPKLSPTNSQAMDRAHRIGQKKVVNVYRMITRATIEEKIMSLQKFKLHTARTVISSDNSDIGSMQVHRLI